MYQFFLSPYGVPPGEFKSKGIDDKTVMKHWRPYEKPDDRIKSFQTWQIDRLNEIATFIWPVYDPRTDDWHGASVATAKGLTELDLEILIDEYIHPDRILFRRPVSPLGVPDMETHGKHYEYEVKNPYPPGFNFRQYDRTLESREEELFLRQMLTAITTSRDVGEKNTGHFWFKNQLQRPRPLHAALRLNQEEHFQSELSERGQHPSIVSGHCLQGIMMCCSVLESWLVNGNTLDPKRQESLAQYMVDVGDRRVFAGVHYPSDNIASWIVALSLIPEVFPQHAVISRFVRDAIMHKSQVFKSISERFFDDSRATEAAELLSRYELTPQLA